MTDTLPLTREAMRDYRATEARELDAYWDTGDSAHLDAIARAEDTVRAAFLSDTAAINRPDHVAGLPIHWLQESLDRAAARAAA